MHGQNRHAGVQGVDVAVGHVSGNGAAAALVHLAQLSGLPDDAVVVEQTADAAHDLAGGVRAAALAPGAGVLAQGDAIVDLGVVALVAGLGVDGVEGVGNVAAQAEGTLQAAAQLALLGLADVLHEGLEEAALMPETPTEPISSLSASTQTAVCSGVSMVSRGSKEA